MTFSPRNIKKRLAPCSNSQRANLSTLTLMRFVHLISQEILYCIFSSFTGILLQLWSAVLPIFENRNWKPVLKFSNFPAILILHEINLSVQVKKWNFDNFSSSEFLIFKHFSHFEVWKYQNIKIQSLQNCEKGSFWPDRNWSHVNFWVAGKLLC